MVTKVGQYLLFETIGKGAFGKVKVALDEETGEYVAVKLLEKSFIRKRKLTQQVKREIAIMKALSHPNVIKLHKILSSPEALYLVMELVTGGELFSIIDRPENRKGVPEVLARTYFQQLVDGVAYCHSKGVIHRDLKPENLLLSQDGVLKIADFGLGAMQNMDTSRFLLQTQCGTPHYLPPEVIKLQLSERQQGYLGSKVDAWACGVILFILLTGKFPFDADDFMDLFDQIEHKDPSYPMTMSKNAKDLISRLLKKDPLERLSVKQVKSHPWYTEDKVEDDIIRQVSTDQEDRISEERKDPITQASRKGKNLFFGPLDPAFMSFRNQKSSVLRQSAQKFESIMMSMTQQQKVELHKSIRSFTNDQTTIQQYNDSPETEVNHEYSDIRRISTELSTSNLPQSLSKDRCDDNNFVRDNHGHEADLTKSSSAESFTSSLENVGNEKEMEDDETSPESSILNALCQVEIGLTVAKHGEKNGIWEKSDEIDRSQLQDIMKVWGGDVMIQDQKNKQIFNEQKNKILLALVTLRKAIVSRNEIIKYFQRKSFSEKVVTDALYLIDLWTDVMLGRVEVGSVPKDKDATLDALKTILSSSQEDDVVEENFEIEENEANYIEKITPKKTFISKSTSDSALSVAQDEYDFLSSDKLRNLNEAWSVALTNCRSAQKLPPVESQNDTQRIDEANEVNGSVNDENSETNLTSAVAVVQSTTENHNAEEKLEVASSSTKDDHSESQVFFHSDLLQSPSNHADSGHEHSYRTGDIHSEPEENKVVSKEWGVVKRKPSRGRRNFSSFVVDPIRLGIEGEDALVVSQGDHHSNPIFVPQTPTGTRNPLSLVNSSKNLECSQSIEGSKKKNQVIVTDSEKKRISRGPSWGRNGLSVKSPARKDDFKSLGEEGQSKRRTRTSSKSVNFNPLDPINKFFNGGQRKELFLETNLELGETMYRCVTVLQRLRCRGIIEKHEDHSIVFEVGLATGSMIVKLKIRRRSSGAGSHVTLKIKSLTGSANELEFQKFFQVFFDCFRNDKKSGKTEMNSDPGRG